MESNWRDYFSEEYDGWEVPWIIVNTFEDRTREDDACPSFTDEHKTFIIYVDHPDGDKRAYGVHCTYRLFKTTEDDMNPLGVKLVDTDDLEKLLDIANSLVEEAEEAFEKKLIAQNSPTLAEIDSIEDLDSWERAKIIRLASEIAEWEDNTFR